MTETGVTTGRSMHVAVLGTGPVGLGSAALLTLRGHQPTLWSPTSGGTEPAEVGVAIHALNRMLKLGRPIPVHIA